MLYNLSLTTHKNFLNHNITKLLRERKNSREMLEHLEVVIEYSRKYSRNHSEEDFVFLFEDAENINLLLSCYEELYLTYIDMDRKDRDQYVIPFRDADEITYQAKDLRDFNNNILPTIEIDGLISNIEFPSILKVFSK